MLMINRRFGTRVRLRAEDGEVIWVVPEKTGEGGLCMLTFTQEKGPQAFIAHQPPAHSKPFARLRYELRDKVCLRTTSGEEVLISAQRGEEEREVALLFEAPRSVEILREEVIPRDRRATR